MGAWHEALGSFNALDQTDFNIGVWRRCKYSDHRRLFPD
jgi:hypothetical protein